MFFTDRLLLLPFGCAIVSSNHTTQMNQLNQSYTFNSTHIAQHFKKKKKRFWVLTNPFMTGQFVIITRSASPWALFSLLLLGKKASKKWAGNYAMYTLKLTFSESKLDLVQRALKLFTQIIVLQLDISNAIPLHTEVNTDNFLGTA